MRTGATAEFARFRIATEVTFVELDGLTGDAGMF